ncbi:MAG: hypothetical protein ACI9LD_002051, partial [Polaromonas sp.]
LDVCLCSLKAAPWSGFFVDVCMGIVCLFAAYR